MILVFPQNRTHICRAIVFLYNSPLPRAVLVKVIPASFRCLVFNKRTKSVDEGALFSSSIMILGRMLSGATLFSSHFAYGRGDYVGFFGEATWLYLYCTVHLGISYARR